jgi:16S rRNA (guanine(1405)-N(7))-methyltransferase
MEFSGTDNNIAENILRSKKYRDVYRPTVERIVAALPQSMQSAERETAARNRLHQVWGAYWETRPDFKKVFSKAESFLKDPITRDATLLTLMRLHASTRERLDILPSFFPRIWAVTGMPTSVIDHGCGCMPLAFPWMGLLPETRYRGYDIDRGQNAFVNAALRAADAPEQIDIQDGDIVADTYPSADVVCMFKLLPLLEIQIGQEALVEVLQRQRSTWLVVSYPTASIGGQEKGMVPFYRGRFQALMKKLGGDATEIVFPEELVFVVRR